jgi:hypothetical protein
MAEIDYVQRLVLSSTAGQCAFMDGGFVAFTESVQELESGRFALREPGDPRIDMDQESGFGEIVRWPVNHGPEYDGEPRRQTRVAGAFWRARDAGSAARGAAAGGGGDAQEHLVGAHEVAIGDGERAADGVGVGSGFGADESGGVELREGGG